MSDEAERSRRGHRGWSFNYNTRLGGEKTEHKVFNRAGDRVVNPVAFATPDDAEIIGMPRNYSEERQEERKKIAQHQTKSKKTLINKGGGKSGGGGGGKFGIINRALGGRSPWSLLKNDKSY